MVEDGLEKIMARANREKGIRTKMSQVRKFKLEE